MVLGSQYGELLLIKHIHYNPCLAFLIWKGANMYNSTELLFQEAPIAGLMGGGFQHFDH